jgi:hypothetical protein
VLDQNNEIALISCHEIYDEKKTDYTLLLNAEDDKSGLYIYRQTNGSINPQKKAKFLLLYNLGKPINLSLA